MFGGDSTAERFAALWTDRVPVATEPALQIILCRTSSMYPADCAGASCAERPPDVEWLSARQRRFADQARLSAAELAADMRTLVAARLGRGEMFFWAVDGRPVASAAFTTTTPATFRSAIRNRTSECLVGHRGMAMRDAFRCADLDGPRISALMDRIPKIG